MLTSRLRLVAINDVYNLSYLPKLQTFLSQLSPVPCAVLLAGDFLSPSILSSIDGGRGMVATLRASGITHFMLGNHEADLPLNTLHDRIQEFKSAKFINTNLRNPPSSASWMTSPLCHEYTIIPTADDRVKVALLGLLSDEPDVFDDKTFKGVPISNVLDTYSSLYKELVPSKVADFVLPMTHQSLQRDKELAQRMLEVQKGNGLIIGDNKHVETIESVADDGSPVTKSIQVIKSGTGAAHASLIDLCFDASVTPAKLKSIESTLVDLKDYQDSAVVKTIAESHLSIVDAMHDEIVVQVDDRMPPGKKLSSVRSRFEQTTVGSLFCQAIKEELEADVALLNGGTIQGDITYENNTMTYAQLQAELPFPTKIVVVPMKRGEVQDAIHYSRTHVDEGTADDANDEISRRGYLQVDLDMDLVPHTGDHDDVLRVALPRNLLSGFCEIQPLMDTGDRLKKEGLFPGTDDFVPAMQLIVRHFAKSRWFEIIHGNLTFKDLDLNGDGVLDRHEVKQMMEKFLGHAPADFVVDNMIASIDKDENGVIDVGELSFLIATMEREEQWRKF